jgi:hypothetical protein
MIRLITRSLLAVGLCFCMVAVTFAQSNGFRAKYKGGTFVTKDKDGKLFVTSDQIRLEMKKGEKLEILPQNVTALSYGKEASRRVKLWVTLGILVSPIALFGLFAKKKDHFIGIEFKDTEDKAGAIMFRADKKEYMALLASLRSVTGKSVIGYPEESKK